MKVIVVRHGETEGNVRRIVESRTHGVLTPVGILQAEAASERLQNEAIDALYTSDLQRCVDTAEIIAQHHPKLALCRTVRLRERNQGMFEGGHWDDLPWLNFEGDHLAHPIPGGESWLEVEARIGNFLNDLITSHSGQTVLLVTHGGPIKAMRSLLGGMSLRQSVDERVLNGEIYRWEMSEPLHRFMTDVR